MNILENSPLYNLSMCSLENFHTSFWKWLGNTYPKDFIQIFTDKKYSNECEILFENQHTSGNNAIFDLFVEIKENENANYIIIENKIKSLPTVEQLEEYEKCMKDEHKHKQTEFRLLTLIPKINVPENNWKHINYLNLTKKMKSIFNDDFHYTNEYHRFLIQDYINVIDKISKVFQIVDTKKLDFYNIPEEIEQLHLRDIYVKCRGEMFANELKEKIKNCEIGSSFHHGKNTIDIVLVKNDMYDFRIQIEGSQFRYCFLPTWDNDEENKEKIATQLLQKNLWFKNTAKYRKEFCKYGKSFIYRYQILEKLFNKNCISDVTYQEIITYIIDEINNFNENYKDIESLVKEYGK